MPLSGIEERIARAETLQRELDSLKAETLADRDELLKLRDDARRRQRVLTSLMGRNPMRHRPHRRDFEYRDDEGPQAA